MDTPRADDPAVAWLLASAIERMRRTVDLVGANAVWDHDGQPFWEGEVEECINGNTVADGAYFGADAPDGRRPLDRRPRGRVWFHVDDGEGMPSVWATLRALRVLRWAEEYAVPGATPASGPAGGASRPE